MRKLQLLTYVPYDPRPVSDRLAKSELDALRRSIDGLSDWQIGRAMGISETEVTLRMRRVATKLGCTTRYEAAIQAIRLGLVDCD